MILSIHMLYFVCYGFVFFFKQKTAYEMRISDWSSDVCSSDLDLRPVCPYGHASAPLAFRFRNEGLNALRPHQGHEHPLPTAMGGPIQGLNALPVLQQREGRCRRSPAPGEAVRFVEQCRGRDRKSTRLNSSH